MKIGHRRYDMDDFNEFIAWGACPLTIIYYIPKIIPYINILRRIVNFEDVQGLYITACYVECFLWYLYGDMLYNDQMKIGYMISMIICSISVIIYLYFESKKYFSDSILNFIIVYLTSWAFYKYITLEQSDNDILLVILCAIASCVVDSFSVYTIHKVIKEKDYNLIQYKIEWIHLFGEIIWCLYGFIDKDFIMGISYGIGVSLSITQIHLYRKLRKKYPLKEKDYKFKSNIDNIVNEDNKRVESTNQFNDTDDSMSSKIKSKPVKIIGKFD